MATFFTAYVEMALRSTPYHDNRPLSNFFSPADLDSETMGKMKSDCLDFQSSNRLDLLKRHEEQAGWDFWCTRNGHPGYDGDTTYDYINRLRDSARSYGPYVLYVQHGKIYGKQG